MFDFLVKLALPENKKWMEVFDRFKAYLNGTKRLDNLDFIFSLDSEMQTFLIREIINQPTNS